ncbi:hypothetical protein [Marinicrinis sediminis]|uniref:Uncharacterized protein n=1 Tax=Marinicrinis sediminis TaxID=1652465 RepID=A0ABW5R6J2_9BACL
MKRKRSARKKVVRLRPSYNELAHLNQKDSLDASSSSNARTTESSHRLKTMDKKKDG